MKDVIQLSDHFTYKRLFRFTIPNILMMIFSSIYGIVDGICVSNFAGKTSFTAINFVMPYLMILGTVGFMFGSGGNALISKTYGEGNSKKANQIFSMIVYQTIIVGAIITILGLVFLRPITELLGAGKATPEMLDIAVEYGVIIVIGMIPFMLQMEFQSLLTTAEKPKLGLFFTIGAGVANMVLDVIFVGLFDWGVKGAAWASVICMCIGGFGPLIYFALPNKSLLRLGKWWFGFKELVKICTNGASEFMNSISMNIVGMLYNYQLLKYAGEDGVAAYGVLMYVCFIFVTVFIGYSIGVAPIIGYDYGAENHDELKNIRKKSTVIILVVSGAMFVFAELLAKPMANIYTAYDPVLNAMTVRGFQINGIQFLFCGISIFGSAFFTALNNGLISAVISFLRTLVFQVAAVLILPIFFGLDGIWLAGVIAEVLSCAFTLLFMGIYKKKYQY